MSLSAEIGLGYDGFTLDVQFAANGGVLGLLGPSGSGKSLTLQAIAGRGHTGPRPDRARGPRAV